MQGKPVITLTTDFGCEDPFAGIMKGVIRGINSDIEIIDITHGISPQDIQTAAYVIGTSFSYFPPNSIHVVVVDPGVGSERRPIMVMTDHHYFIGPDNGVFSYIYRMRHEQLEVTHITAEHYFLPSRGATFHGRDVFAPVAAYFSKGIRPEKFGELVTDQRSIPLPFPRLTEDGRLHGEVIHIDRFGNAITNISASDMDRLGAPKDWARLKVMVKGREAPLRQFYSEGADRGLYVLVNSADYIEFFTYRGNAASEYGIAVGDGVEVFPE